jgi:hypothetical protein
VDEPLEAGGCVRPGTKFVLQRVWLRLRLTNTQGEQRLELLVLCHWIHALALNLLLHL